MIDRALHILIVDDLPRARQGLKALLATWPHSGEIEEAADGREAVRRVEQSCPDVVLMDVRMPEMNGLQATREMKAHRPQVMVILLSMIGGYKAEALAAGADAFLNKSDVPGRLLESLEQLFR